MSYTPDTPQVPGVSRIEGPLLEVSGLHVSYASRGLLRAGPRVPAVDGVTFAIRRGKTVALVGESGSGKTTIARAILQLIPVESGEIVFDGKSLSHLSRRALRALRRRMQMVFQDPYSSLDPRLSVEEIIREPLDIHREGSRASRETRVTELMLEVGLSPARRKRKPREFSGGQRQRVAIARAIALNPDLVIADEPISALDVSIQAQILTLLRNLQNSLGLTYLLIAHDLAVVRQVSHRVAVMYWGKLVEEGPTDAIFKSPKHPYTVALISAVPIPDPALEKQRRRIILTGDVPSSTRPPEGCRFHPRCWLRDQLGKPEICATDEPPLRDATSAGGTEHSVACHFSEQIGLARTYGPKDRTLTGQ